MSKETKSAVIVGGIALAIVVVVFVLLAPNKDAASPSATPAAPTVNAPAAPTAPAARTPAAPAEHSHGDGAPHAH